MTALAFTPGPTPVPPRALNHIGITVPDVWGAIDWYGAVFGFALVMGPRVLQAGAVATHETPSIFGPRFRKAYQAHLVTANGIGLEMFQFVDPPVEEPADKLEYWRRGYWHLAFTAPDIDAFCERVVAAGGKRRIPTFTFIPGRPYQLIYCEDPWGNIIELFSHHYVEAFGNWPQPGMQGEPMMLTRDGREVPLLRATTGQQPAGTGKP